MVGGGPQAGQALMFCSASTQDEGDSIVHRLLVPDRLPPLLQICSVAPIFSSEVKQRLVAALCGCCAVSVIQANNLYCCPTEGCAEVAGIMSDVVLFFD